MNANAPAPLLLDVHTTCRVLSIGRRKLWELTNSGQLQAVRIGRVVRYDPDDLRAFIEAHKTKGAP